MNGAYQTVFEISYFSNGSLLESFAFLCAGIIAIVVIVFGWKFSKISRSKLILFSYVGLPFWFLFSGFWFYSNISTGKMWTSALANNQCEVVEGIVQVLHQQPWSGHDVGDHISIGGKDFTYSDYVETLGYHQTISHGGQLKNGVVARLHYIGDVILKVEIKQ